MSTWRERLGRALYHPSYRRYFIGMLCSHTGTWIQAVGAGWVVVELTGSGLALGLVTALQFGPILLVGPWGGLLADRVDKRRLLIALQVGLGLAALSLAALDATGRLTTTALYVITGVFGLFNALDNPTRRSFIAEMVPREAIQNAVSLQTAATTSTRVVGPVIAGLLIAGTGTATTFACNAASFAAFALVLASIDAHQLRRTEVTRARGQLRRGFVRAWQDRGLRTPLAMILVVSILTFEYEVVLPLLAEQTFAGTALTYGLLFSGLSVGNIVGALVAASREDGDETTLSWACLLLAAATAMAAAAPTLPIALLGLVIAGGAGAAFFSTANAMVQHRAGDEMRGRMLALLSIFFLGARPVGGPLVGLTANRFGPRAALLMGVAGALGAAAIGLSELVRRHRTTATPPDQREPPPRPAHGGP